MPILGNHTKISMESLKVNDVALVVTYMINYANSYFVSTANNITNGLISPVAFLQTNNTQIIQNTTFVFE